MAVLIDSFIMLPLFVEGFVPLENPYRLYFSKRKAKSSLSMKIVLISLGAVSAHVAPLGPSPLG
jgi:hypothetical protein